MLDASYISLKLFDALQVSYAQRHHFSVRKVRVGFFHEKFAVILCCDVMRRVGWKTQDEQTKKAKGNAFSWVWITMLLRMIYWFIKCILCLFFLLLHILLSQQQQKNAKPKMVFGISVVCFCICIMNIWCGEEKRTIFFRTKLIQTKINKQKKCEKKPAKSI